MHGGWRGGGGGGVGGGESPDLPDITIMDPLHEGRRKIHTQHTELPVCRNSASFLHNNVVKTIVIHSSKGGHPISSFLRIRYQIVR